MIEFFPIQKRNIRTQEIKWYAQISPVTVVDKEKLIDEIESRCTLTSSDIKAALDALQESIIDHVRNGTSVRLGDLGSFRPTITSQACDTAAEVSADAIKSVRCRFTPSGYMRRALQKTAPHVRFSKAGSASTETTETTGEGAA